MIRIHICPWQSAGKTESTAIIWATPRRRRVSWCGDNGDKVQEVETLLCQGNTSSWWYSPLSRRNVCCQCRHLSAQTPPRLSRARLGSVKTTGIIISTNWIRDGLLVLTFTSWPRSGWPHRRTFYHLISCSIPLSCWFISTYVCLLIILCSQTMWSPNILQEQSFTKIFCPPKSIFVF